MSRSLSWEGPKGEVGVVEGRTSPKARRGRGGHTHEASCLHLSPVSINHTDCMTPVLWLGDTGHKMEMVRAHLEAALTPSCHQSLR